MDRTIWKNSVKELSAYDILYIERIYPCIFAEFLFGKFIFSEFSFDIPFFDDIVVDFILFELFINIVYQN